MPLQERMARPQFAEMTNAFLTKSGIKTWIGGNYGNPLIEYVRSEEKADVLNL